MSIEEKYISDAEIILSHRYDNGSDYWSTDDRKLLKGAPYTTLESILYLLELGMQSDNKVMRDTANLIFSNWRQDGKIKVYSGGIYPCHTALAINVLSMFLSDNLLYDDSSGTHRGGCVPDEFNARN